MRRKRSVRVNAKKLRPPPKENRTRSIRIRATEAEHAEMTATARKLGLNLSDYLRELHRQAVASLSKGGG